MSSGTDWPRPVVVPSGRRFRPQGTNRQRPDPVAEFERLWPGVEHDSPHETLTELFGQPEEMLRVPYTRCGGGLDLDTDDSATTEVDNQIHFLAARFRTQVMQPGPRMLRRSRGAVGR